MRTVLQPGDVGAIVAMHGVVYAEEYGFDATFEAYVAAPMAEFVLRASPRERIWIEDAQRGGIAGCVAIVTAAPEVAQLRWFLVHPSARGTGLGGRLLREALAFCVQAGYRRIVLWTVAGLDAAQHLYRRAGFRVVESNPVRRWGVDVVEEQHEMSLIR